MAKHSAANARIKREYFIYLKEAQRRDEGSIDAVAKALARFEDATGHKDFKTFHRQQAVAFKQQLDKQIAIRTGKPLSRATVNSTLSALRAFFIWLAGQPGYKSRISYGDADYFNLAEKDVAIARGRREKRVPDRKQVSRVLAAMPSSTVIERRDRAVVAFTALTGARVMALATFRLGHVNLDAGYVDQDARTVATKFSKTFRTVFMPVCDGALEIVTDWVNELREKHHRGADDPLFPSTEMGLGEHGGFQPQGLARQGWASSGPIRDVFKRAFTGAGIPYYNPHSFRDMLVRHAMTLSLTPEEMKAWSQNLGHNDVLTTLTSYGAVPVHRQRELIRASSQPSKDDPLDNPIVRALIHQIKNCA
jgi:integrase